MGAALHFPAAASIGTAEASRSKSSVFTKFAVASSLPPELLCIFHFTSGSLQLQKNSHICCMNSICNVVKMLRVN